MNFFFRDYELSPQTLNIRHNKKLYAFSCIVDFFKFMGLYDTNELQILNKYYTYNTYKKNEIMLSENVNINKFFFIVEGAVRSYRILNNEERTEMLCTEGNFLTNLGSFVNGAIPDTVLVAVEDCIVLETTHEDFQKMQRESVHIAMAMSKGMSIYLQYQQGFSMAMKEDAKSKFFYLQKNMPQIANRFSLKHQASFLGIKPETLSRIRNEIRFM